MDIHRFDFLTVFPQSTDTTVITGAGMAVDSGVLDEVEKQGMGAVTEALGLCGLELVMSGAVGTAVAGVAPVQWSVLLKSANGVVPVFLDRFGDRLQSQAFAAKLQKKDIKVYCIIGDGEMQEGTNWEALPSYEIYHFLLLIYHPH